MSELNEELRSMDVKGGVCLYGGAVMALVYDVGGLERLKAISIVESPLRFRIRKILVLENFLSRV